MRRREPHGALGLDARSLFASRRARGLPGATGSVRTEHLAAALGGLGRGRRSRGAGPRRREALALSPLREVRRALKPGFDGVDDAPREGLRDDVKAAELRAERVLMEALEAMTPKRGGAHALAVLQAASKA